MKIGLWNIDHPESASGSKSKELRFRKISDYLLRADCDAYVITEANAAMVLPGYSFELSAVSSFKSSRRFYGSPNSYHQVAIYSKTPPRRLDVSEAVNSLSVVVGKSGQSILIYGNVVTIKDQWSKTSNFTYADRLNQQIEAIQGLDLRKTLVAGDFNLRLGWPQKSSAHAQVGAKLVPKGWVWPTRDRDDTVQHVLHSPDLEADLTIDFGVKYDSEAKTGLSDHPFIEISLVSTETAGEA